MRKWETLTALAAVVLASVGSIPHVPFRSGFTLAAVALIAAVGLSRLAATFKRTSKQPATFDPAARAKMIREERNKTDRKS